MQYRTYKKHVKCMHSEKVNTLTYILEKCREMRIKDAWNFMHIFFKKISNLLKGILILRLLFVFFFFLKKSWQKWMKSNLAGLFVPDESRQNLVNLVEFKSMYSLLSSSHYSLFSVKLGKILRDWLTKEWFNLTSEC